MISLRVLVPLALAVVASACEKKDTRESGPAALAPRAASSVAPPAVVDGGSTVETVEVPEVRVKGDASTTVRVTWITPKGTAVNDEAPFRVRWNRSDGLADAPADVKSTGSAVMDGFRVSVRPMSGAPNATLDGEIHIVVCDVETHSVCVPVTRHVQLGFIVTKDAAEEATVAIPLPEAKPP